MNSPSTPLPQGPLVAFYGDDFTGSSASMEAFAWQGLKSVLFLDLPSPERLAEFADYRCIGVAGIARSKSPQWMDAHLPAIFRRLAQTGAPIIQYKVCSTFDSAPQTGSIGKAADIGASLFPGPIAMLVGDLGMGRLQVFGNLFAQASGTYFRLDRHPTMAKHPSTPMQEADLARHLSLQSALPVANVSFLELKRGDAAEEHPSELRRRITDLLDRSDRSGDVARRRRGDLDHGREAEVRHWLARRTVGAGCLLARGRRSDGASGRNVGARRRSDRRGFGLCVAHDGRADRIRGVPWLRRHSARPSSGVGPASLGRRTPQGRGHVQGRPAPRVAIPLCSPLWVPATRLCGR